MFAYQVSKYVRYKVQYIAGKGRNQVHKKKEWRKEGTGMRERGLFNVDGKRAQVGVNGVETTLHPFRDWTSKGARSGKRTV